MKRKSARERVVITTSSRTQARSPLSNMPFAKVNDCMIPAALPVRWADDMQSYIASSDLHVDQDGAPIIEPLSFLDALEKEIDKSGGIVNVMVIPDGVDVQKMIDKEMRRREAEQTREIYRRNLGLDV